MKKCLCLIPRMTAGGAERVMATIANNLCSYHKVTILTFTDDNSFYRLDENVEILGLGQSVNRKNKFAYLMSAALGGLKLFFKLGKYIREYKPDVVLAFLREPILFSIIFKMFGVIKCPLVVSERNDPTKEKKLSQWFERNFYHKADRIVCQSNRVCAFFKEKHQSKTVVIPNPIAYEAIPPRFEGERRNVIVSVGRLRKQKNLSLLLRAFSQLPSEFSNFDLEIYGSGDLENVLQEEIQSLGLLGRAKLMGTKRNVMYHISDAALFVMSSDYEGFPNALVEAMATGLPVISTDFSTGVARDMINEENGIVIPVGDERSLISAMVKMLSQRDKWEDFSRSNRIILTMLGEKDIISKWIEVLGL